MRDVVGRQPRTVVEREWGLTDHGGDLVEEVYNADRTNGRVNPAADLHQPLGVGATRNLTDLGNAERFVDDHRRHARYCYAWGCWLIFDGKRWAVDDDGNAERLMQETVRRIYVEASNETDDTRRSALADHARRSEARARIADALHLARSALAVRPEELDADPYLLNCANGTMDLRTGQLREHRIEDMLTKLAAPCADLMAKPPIFCGFIETILPDVDLRNFVQAAIGYAAIGENTEEVLPIFYGHGANGKSTLVNAVMEALGDYATQAAPDLLLAKRGAHPTELADLFGARFVASVETDDGRRLNEGLVKQLTGRDRIKARRMREDFWEFAPSHTVFLATNHRPEIRGTDHAIWRRIKLVPFGVTIPDAEQDKRLPKKLREELPAILSWIVRGALMYRKVGLPEAPEVKAATEGYRANMDVLAGWIEERCVVGEGVWCKFSTLYEDYRAWCEESNETTQRKRKFADLLTERGFEKDNATNNVAIRRGIALRFGGGTDPARVNDPHPEEAPAPTENPPEEGGIVNPGRGELTIVTSEKTCKSQDFVSTINEDYLENSMNGHESSTRALYAKHVNGRYFDNFGGITPRDGGTGVESLLANPPEWLAKQLENLRRDPERLFSPTTHTILSALTDAGACVEGSEVERELLRHLYERRGEGEGRA